MRNGNQATLVIDATATLVQEAFEPAMVLDNLEKVFGSLPFVIGSGITTLLLGSALAYVLLETRKNGQVDEPHENGDEKTSKGFNKEEYPGGKVDVYYATQTGTAESFARQLEREGPEHGFFVHVADVEDIELETLIEQNESTEASEDKPRIVFLTATYGEGEPPDTATLFVQALQEKADMEILFEERKPSSESGEQCLDAVSFSVFGLGNRQYEHFNAMGKFFDMALHRCGASRIAPLGLGNEDDDLEGDFESWKENHFWPAMKKKYLADADSSALKVRRLSATNGSVTLPDCKYVVELHDDGDKKSEIALDHVHSSSRPYFTAVDCPVKKVCELRTKEDTGSTVHVELDLSKAEGLTYETADNLGVLPLNDPGVVASVAESLGFDLDQVFSLKAAPNHEWHGAPFPMPLTVRECLTRYCDLTGAPRRSDLKLLAAYAKDPTDQKALLRMSSKEGRSEYREKIVDGLVGLADLFKRCPSISMPLEHFLSVCPSLQSRFFTISSSSSVHPKEVHLTVAVSREQRQDGSVFRGVCSNYLAESKPQTMVRVYNRASTFRLPKDSSRPIIMIGPGTGIAPMRALLQERAYQRKQLGKVVGQNILYFGCKKSTQDFIYKDELQAFRDDGHLHQLHLAFSREEKYKVYVQHLLQRNSAETYKLINDEGAYVYVCGGVKMGHDVSEALKEIIRENGNMTPDKAKEYLSSLAREGRLVQELWA